MMRQVSGPFDVTLQAQPDAFPGRHVLDKHYHGALDAHGEGQMLAAMTAVAGSAGYVAIERVTGILEGREGSFVIQHHGLMNRGTPELQIAVVPDSGTGALEGLTGRMAIRFGEDGAHFYDFTYSLPGVAEA
jgi:hypothetical protein